MLQIPYIRQNKEEVLRRLAKKHFQAGEIVEKLLQTDDLRKKLLTEKEDIQFKINSASKQIKELMMSGQKDKAESVKAEVVEVKNKMAPVSEQLAAAEKEVDELLVQLPNLPHDSVPEGKTPEDNVVVREGGMKTELYAGALPHWDLAKKFDLIDFEAGNKVTGSGFPFYKGRGAKLQRALIQYFLDYNTAAGYLEYEAPLMVNEASAYGTGQLPDKEGQMYHVQIDNFYLIPTAEVPLTNLYRGDIIPVENLPVKLTGYTPCFRREAGSYGKDVRGLNRLHQFDKVEIVQICEPSKSYEALEGMVAHVEKLLTSLELPYRILRLCGGDMSFTSALTYDFEVFSEAQQRWLEVSSVSNFESFQANRAKIRYKDAEGKNHIAHTLNGSSLALPRIVAALLENHQTEINIHIPESLQPYFGSSWMV
ncbi:MAG: serine--tRNA ligase [Chitinophagaceae bacterium]|nr:serine--tRNA ligase [Chitinophagaceae bacterium]